jgi:putative membrane protein
MTPVFQSASAPWSVSVPATFALLLAASIYLRGWLCLRGASLRVTSAWQLASFMNGMFALWIALGSTMRTLHHELLSFHMVDHVLLMAVAPPLILLGDPFRSFAHGFPKWFVADGLTSLLRSSAVQRLLRFLDHSMLCWLPATIALIVWHVPAAFELAMRSDRWHEVEYASFFGTGLLFWLPVIRPWPNATRRPRWSIVLYLFFATFPCDALSAFLTFCDRVVYPGYLSGTRHFTVSPLQDQQCAGALMWVCVTFIYLIPAVMITTKLLSAPSSRDTDPVAGALPQFAARPPAVSESVELFSLQRSP